MMEGQSVLNKISPQQQEFAERLMNLAIGRAFKSVYLKVSDGEKKEMEKIFELGSDKEKEKFIEKYLPNFKQVYKEELAKLGEELKQEMG